MQHDIVSSYQDLLKLINEREKRLNEAMTYFTFIRECNELQEWMNDQLVKAASEDYGTDVEHVELLTKTFETFFNSLLNSKTRVDSFIDNAQKLINTCNNEYGNKIEAKTNEVKDQWTDLLELANARLDALKGAKQVHMFDRNADETIAWINEKESTLIDDYYGKDLDETRSLIRQHSQFENELIALKQQVEEVENDAEKLIELFPDAEEHIDVKREDVRMFWDEIIKKSTKRKEQLYQAEQLQTYFEQHQDLM